MAKFPSGQPVERKIADGHPFETLNRDVDGFKHPPNLAVSPFVNGHLNDRLLLVHVHIDVFNFCRVGFLSVEDDAFAELVQQRTVHDRVGVYPIRLRNVVFGMGQYVRKLPVVAQQQQPFGIVVEPSNRINPRRNAVHVIERRLAFSGVIGGGEDAFGFVKGNIDERLRCRHASPVHRHVVRAHIDFRPQLCDDFSIDGNASLQNKLFARASRSAPCGSQHFL